MKTEKEAIIKSILKCLLLELSVEVNVMEVNVNKDRQQNRTYTLIAKMLVLCFFSISSKQMNVWYKSMPMIGFEPRTYDIGSDHSTNCATTTAQIEKMLPTNIRRS